MLTEEEGGELVGSTELLMGEVPAPIEVMNS